MKEKRNGNPKSLMRTIVILSMLVASILMPLGALEQRAYQEGYAIGSSQASEIQQNIAAMKSAAQLRSTNFSKVLRLAKENETLLAAILPEKLEWMHGVADGSRIPYDDILIYNTTDRL